MARCNNRQQPRKCVAQPAMRFDQRRFLTGMGGRRGNCRAVTDRQPQGPKVIGIGWRLGHVELEIAGRRDARSAEVAIASCIGRRLREAEIEATEHGGNCRRNVAPAPEGAFRKPAIDEDQRNPPIGTREDQIRPQVGFGEQPEVRFPMS